MNDKLQLRAGHGSLYGIRVDHQGDLTFPWGSLTNAFLPLWCIHLSIIQVCLVICRLILVTSTNQSFSRSKELGDSGTEFLRHISRYSPKPTPRAALSNVLYHSQLQSCMYFGMKPTAEDAKSAASTSTELEPRCHLKYQRTHDGLPRSWDHHMIWREGFPSVSLFS